MARKKADEDPRQKPCEQEAMDVVLNFYKGRKEIEHKSLRVVWFAFINQSGFKCMITSETYPNEFFEVTINKVTGEMRCDCFTRYEYIVKPSNHGKISQYQTDIFI